MEIWEWVASPQGRATLAMVAAVFSMTQAVMSLVLLIATIRWYRQVKQWTDRQGRKMEYYKRLVNQQEAEDRERIRRRALE